MGLTAIAPGEPPDQAAFKLRGIYRQRTDAPLDSIPQLHGDTPAHRTPPTILPRSNINVALPR
jgi:hypothetical protein